jgi:hypothetical protein
MIDLVMSSKKAAIRYFLPRLIIEYLIPRTVTIVMAYSKIPATLLIPVLEADSLCAVGQNLCWEGLYS